MHGVAAVLSARESGSGIDVSGVALRGEPWRLHHLARGEGQVGATVPAAADATRSILVAGMDLM